MMRAHVSIADRDVPWKAVTIQRSLDAFCGSASVALALNGSLPVVGAPLRVSVSGHGDPATLLIGYTDAVGAGSTSMGGEVTVEGRDRTADLIDGTRIGVDFKFFRPTLLDVARAIASHWGLAVVDEVGAAALQLPTIAGQPGETAYEILERAARLHGVLLTTTPDGKIRLGRPERVRANVELRTGKAANITRWTFRSDGSQRFRRTQILDPGSLYQMLNGPAARPQGIAEDAGVRAQRESVTISPGALVGDELDALARWTVTVARARSASLTVEYRSWLAGPDGPVWTPGMLVSVDIPEAGITGKLLVSAVELTWDEGGDRASLGLVSPAAYEIDPTEAERLRRGSVEALVQ